MLVLTRSEARDEGVLEQSGKGHGKKAGIFAGTFGPFCAAYMHAIYVFNQHM